MKNITKIYTIILIILSTSVYSHHYDERYEEALYDTYAWHIYMKKTYNDAMDLRNDAVENYNNSTWSDRKVCYRFSSAYDDLGYILNTDEDSLTNDFLKEIADAKRYSKNGTGHLRTLHKLIDDVNYLKRRTRTLAREIKKIFKKIECNEYTSLDYISLRIKSIKMPDVNYITNDEDQDGNGNGNGDEGSDSNDDDFEEWEEV